MRPSACPPFRVTASISGTGTARISGTRTDDGSDVSLGHAIGRVADRLDHLGPSRPRFERVQALTLDHALDTVGVQHLRFGELIAQPAIGIVPVIANAGGTELQRQGDHPGLAVRFARLGELCADRFAHVPDI